MVTANPVFPNISANPPAADSTLAGSSTLGLGTGTGTGTGTSTGTSTGTGTGTSLSGNHPDDKAPRATELMDRVVQGAHDTIDRLAESAAPHVQRLSEGVASAGETLSGQAAQVRDIGDEWADSLRSTVREHPLAALATAIAAGLLIGKLTR